MRPKVLVLLIISIFLPLLHCYGQYVDDENFPDTVRSYNSKVYAIPNLDSLKPKIVDTITNPDGFVIY